MPEEKPPYLSPSSVPKPSWLCVCVCVCVCVRACMHMCAHTCICGGDQGGYLKTPDTFGEGLKDAGKVVTH